MRGRYRNICAGELGGVAIPEMRQYETPRACQGSRSGCGERCTEPMAWMSSYVVVVDINKGRLLGRGKAFCA